MNRELAEYEQKRSLERSGEPPAEKGARQGPLLFVVQKHHARRLHYDFRLEVDGVLKSWAVPKGPSLDPDHKRLAAMVEDHPLDYASFEGVIPKGEYGAGEVVVWDAGTYSPDEGGKLQFADRDESQAQMREGLEKGKVSFFLRGHKLKGSWTLVKTRRGENDWLLMKHRDEYARPGYDVLTEEKSVLSGRMIAEVNTASRHTSYSPLTVNPGVAEGAKSAPFPGFVPPMLASLADAPFSNPSWVFEPKLDGYRIITTLREGEVTLWSRRGLSVTDKYALLIPALRRQPASEIILDGEIVAMDERGRVCFQCLQRYLQMLGAGSGVGQVPLIYYVFDILYLDGYDLRNVPLSKRKQMLHDILRTSDEVRLIDFFENDGKVVFEAAIKNGLEGIMGKRADSLYESGRRSRDWLKMKAMHTEDFVIAGYTAGESARAGSFGALLLGYYNAKGELKFVGHVGSGFDEQGLAELRRRLDALRSDRCPFDEAPETNTPPTWVRPELVAEVKYGQWTEDGRLRIPVFLHLRDDKAAAEVRRTEVVSTPSSPGGSPRADAVADILRQLVSPKNGFAIDVEGNRIGLTNIDKVLWPATEAHPPLTKRHFLTYLAQVSPYLLPHLKDRPITLSRYPDGIDGEHFWQKHWGHPVPGFVQTATISEEKGKSGEYLLCQNLSTLLWLGQLADIEFHTWFSRVSPEPDMAIKANSELSLRDHPDEVGRRSDLSGHLNHILDYPDFIIFDIDPYIYSGKEKPGDEPELNRQAFANGCEVASWLKEVLDSLPLPAYVKTSGKTGLHVYVPIMWGLDYRQVRRAAETIGRFLLQKHPRDITMEWAPEKRTGKVFIDYAQNVRGKTLACVYSPRPTPEAAVSTPLAWDELDKAYPTDFSILTVPDRLKHTGDLWADILSAKRDLGAVLGKELL